MASWKTSGIRCIRSMSGDAGVDIPLRTGRYGRPLLVVMSVSCGECGYAGTLPTPLLDTCSAKNVFLGRAQTEMKRFSLGQRSCPISSARDPHCAMGCFASRPRVDDPAATSRIDRSDPTTTTSSSPERRHVPATSSRRHRRGPRDVDLTVRVPDDDDDDGSDGDDDPDAVRAIVMVQSPDHIVTASTMRVSRGRSSLYESTADRHASASSSWASFNHSDRPCASATTTGTSACSLPGATMVTSPTAAASSGPHVHITGGTDGHLTHEAIELERATREVRRACAVVAAAATTSSLSKGSTYLSSSGLSTLSSGSSSIDRSRSRSSSRCPSRGSDRGSYHGDLAAVESDVIAKVARLVYLHFRMYGQLG